jgi:small subunit ribosomal protein S21
MLKVEIKDGVTIDRALKILKIKVNKTKQVKHLRDRQAYVKPSEVRRAEIKKAVYIQKLKQSEEDGE